MDYKKKERILPLRLSDDQHATLKKQSGDRGMTMTGYIWHLIVNDQMSKVILTTPDQNKNEV
jgi:predicted DNA binding CopG/RHH family protein